jgi:hypothetical protein
MAISISAARKKARDILGLELHKRYARSSSRYPWYMIDPNKPEAGIVIQFGHFNAVVDYLQKEERRRRK